MEKLAAEIERNPLTKKFRQEEAIKTLAMRQEAAAKLKTLRREQSEVIPKLREAVEDREIAYLNLKTTLDAAGGELQRARAELSSENNNFDSAIGTLEADLIESADLRIEEGIEFFRAKLHWLRLPGRISRTACGSERNIFTMEKTVTEESNVQAINDAMKYCQVTIKELEKMKLSPTLNPEWIEELKGVVPRIDIFIETTGTKPIPGSRGINPRDLLKSDGQLSWEMRKINEKFQKVMRK